jgi:hypothetical protein
MTAPVNYGVVVSCDECWEKVVEKEPVVVVTLTTQDGARHRFEMDVETAQCLGQGLQLTAEEAHAAWQAVKAFRMKKGVD